MSKRGSRTAAMVVLAVAAAIAPLISSATAVGQTTPTRSPTSSVTPTPSPTSPATPTPSQTETSRPYADAVRDENLLSGATSGFIDKRRGRAAGLDAFADRVSVLPGESFGLYVSVAAAQTVHIRALRVGWYGGKGLREVWRSDVQARRQPAAQVWGAPLSRIGGHRSTGAMFAPWAMSALVPTVGWPEGVYLIRLDARRASRYVLITVRSQDLTGRLVLVDSPMTYQAYNVWGGTNLYGDARKVFAHRSLAVSFNRPYSDGFGAGRFLTYMRPLVQEAERLGLPLAWTTDYDLAREPSRIHGAAGIVLSGHAEYWTAPLWTAVVSAIRQGTNLASFGANVAYWRVRLAGDGVSESATPTRADGSPRFIFAPKRARLDPLASTDPSGATTRFSNSPAARRESDLTGMRYDCFPAAADWVVTDPSWWGYSGTHVHRGTRLVGLVGPESDVLTAHNRPKPSQVVAFARYSCGKRTTVHTGVYWTNSAGAGVFAAGTMNWPRLMLRGSAAPVVRKITDNVLTALATAGAGKSHPARDTADSFALPRR